MMQCFVFFLKNKIYSTDMFVVFLMHVLLHCTVVPTKSVSDVILSKLLSCTTRIDRSLVY